MTVMIEVAADATTAMIAAAETANNSAVAVVAINSRVDEAIDRQWAVTEVQALTIHLQWKITANISHPSLMKN